MRAIIGLLVAAASAVAAYPQDYTHKSYFDHYEGTKTCLSCHEEDAESFFHSQHYQWKGLAPHVSNSGGIKLGKLNTVNDFCTNPQANWIGVVRNSRGEVLSKGCSACHPSFGSLPAETSTRPQLENIDCLVCHASGYRRDLYPTEAGGWEWKPILWKNQAGLDSVSKRISLPTRTMCLRCHANSGGGPNWKRGDIEYAMRDGDENLDVHMASNGLDMQCVTCHAGEDHRVRGRGTDLAGSDMPEAPLSCDTAECHSSQPHGLLVLDQHSEKVYCTSCHIPRFAQTAATDMVRDWSKPVYQAKRDKYYATVTLEKNVKPVLNWYNGSIRTTLPRQPVQRTEDGRMGVMLPEGSREDPDSKLYAFKLHRGRMPVLEEEDWIVPIVVEEFFAHGDIDRAVRHAAKDLYGLENPQYRWMDSVRYMGIFHGVKPAAQALQCLDCHRAQGGLDWRALGYEQDPLAAVMHEQRSPD